MSDGRPLRLDPLAPSADPTLPAFIARPDGAPSYHGFAIVPESLTDGWTYGAISEFELDEPATDGDGFVVAPDGSRAGIVWATDTDEFSVIIPRDHDYQRWGVYGVRVSRPVGSLDDLVLNFREMLPRLRDQYELLHGRRL